MESDWSACPSDILQRCFGAQADHSDNAAAACLNKLWRDTFRSGGLEVNLTYDALRPTPDNSYLQQLSEVTSVTLRRCFVRHAEQTWLPGSAAQRAQNIETPVWAATLSQVNPACSSLTLDHYLPKADACNTLQTSALAQALSQLTNLRQLTVQDDFGDIPMEFLSKQTNLSIASGRPGA